MTVEVKRRRDSSSKDNFRSKDDRNTGNKDDDGFKLHISRVPTKFSEDVVKQILETKLGSDCVSEVTLIYPREEDEEDEEENKNANEKNKEEKGTVDGGKGNVADEGAHRGFGFVTFITAEWLEKALELQTIRGGRKPTSTKKHTMYLRPYHAPAPKGSKEPSEFHSVCYLWSQNRCPYGDDCKFSHVGPGSCRVVTSENDAASKKKKQKCFAFKKGKCPRGDDCPFSHDFVADQTITKVKKCTEATPDEPKTDTKDLDKHCINWKTKGKCRKGDKCPYRHDETLQKLALEKKNEKKRQRDTTSHEQGEEDEETHKNKKPKQPLSVRVFGLNYDTTEQDVRDFFQHCGPIVEVTFPTYEDSGRSKGYCCVLFQSPKAVDKAIELDGQELFGRWLRIQSGKMKLRQWEENEKTAKEGRGRGGGDSESFQAEE